MINETLQKELDKLCRELAAKHSTSEKFININIQVSMLATKLGIFATHSTSKVINIQESISIATNDMVNIILVSAALAGFPEDAAPKLMEIYQEVTARLAPLLAAYYTPAQGKH